MPRILGIVIPDKKKIVYSLPYVYGLGFSTSRIILRTVGIDENKLAKDLTTEELNKIQKIIELSYKVEGDLRKEVTGNIKRL
ncbi:MAG: 30S ribosomal protein S13, partial [Candidatus Yanofskybacteria bacterium GW2011_GWF2_43_596]